MSDIVKGKKYLLFCEICKEVLPLTYKGSQYTEGMEEFFSPEEIEVFENQHLFDCHKCTGTFGYETKDLPNKLEEIE